MLLGVLELLLVIRVGEWLRAMKVKWGKRGVWRRGREKSTKVIRGRGDRGRRRSGGGSSERGGRRGVRGSQ